MRDESPAFARIKLFETVLLDYVVSVRSYPSCSPPFVLTPTFVCLFVCVPSRARDEGVVAGGGEGQNTAAAGAVCVINPRRFLHALDGGNHTPSRFLHAAHPRQLRLHFEHPSATPGGASAASDAFVDSSPTSMGRRHCARASSAVTGAPGARLERRASRRRGRPCSPSPTASFRSPSPTASFRSPSP